MSDPHKDIDVEEHVRTIMGNISRSKANAAEIRELKVKQDDVREVKLPGHEQRISANENLLKRFIDLPEKVTELMAYQVATRWMLVTIVLLVGAIITIMQVVQGIG